MNTRLKDIAERAGVSVMTVSKVLRDAPDISAATKARIRELAKEMGYMPDSLAQGLRTRTTRLLGLVLPSFADFAFSKIALTIEERAHELGYDLIAAQTLNDPEREETSIRRLLSRRVDGIFIAPVYRLAPRVPIYEDLTRRETPAVILGQPAPFCRALQHVTLNDQHASAAATRHLLDLGHRRIAFFAGPTSAPWAQQRLEGYRHALREAEIQPDDRLVFMAGCSLEEGQNAALQLIQETAFATAVQAAHDLAAIGAMKVFLEQGRKIPQDLSLIGFGNIPLSDHLAVPLTTLHIPQVRLGTAAVETMARLLQRQQPAPCQLPADLIVRASTAPPLFCPPEQRKLGPR